MTKPRESKRLPSQNDNRSDETTLTPSADTNEYINIWYDVDESGPAQLIGEGLARIAALPITHKVFLDDLVKLSGDPEAGVGPRSRRSSVPPTLIKRTLVTTRQQT
jgi:hypothetical protein